jgi:hypothetical protein
MPEFRDSIQTLLKLMEILEGQGTAKATLGAVLARLDKMNGTIATHTGQIAVLERTELTRTTEKRVAHRLLAIAWGLVLVIIGGLGHHAFAHWLGW